MLTGGTDLFYRRILAAGHGHYARVEVWSGTGQQLAILPRHTGSPEGGLVFLDGGVSATLSNRVSRNMSLTVPMDLYPTEVTDLLAPFGNELRVFYGVMLGDGSDVYVWQVFRGRIRNVVQSSDGTCRVECADRASDVQDVNFVSPQNSIPTNTISEEFERLIVDAVPNATFGASDTFSKIVEPLTWQSERASAIDEMARSVGALWYPLANGDYVIRRFPWNVSSPPVLTLTDQPGGTVNGWSVRRTRDSIFNVVTVTGERLNGDAPVYATASDTTPGSPTNTTGNFGIRSRLERLQSPATSGGAFSAAEALLRTYIAPTEEWNLSAVPDASLELGDTVTLQVNDREVIQVVTDMSLPLGLAGDMTISTRSLVIGGTF
jgi:hypothetical protein